MGMRGHQMSKTVVTLPDHQHHLHSHSALPNHYAHSSHHQHHHLAHSTLTPNHHYAHSPPLLVVSPTSPRKSPAHLPELVTREPHKKRHVAAPVTNCTSWLHPEGEPDSSQRASTSLTSASAPSPSPVSLRQGFRGSRIPVRSARRAGLRRSEDEEGAPARYLRSRSLTKLPLEEAAMTRTFRLGSSRSPPPSPHSPHSPSPSSPSPRGDRKKKDERGSRRAAKNGISSPCTPLSPPHCSRHAQHAHAPVSPHALRRHRHASPPRLEHEPYETPQYFTFHLTLRSPARATNPGRARNGARNDGSAYSTADTIASSAARRCVEDMILQSCTLSRSPLPQSTRVPRTIHMPQVPRTDLDVEIRADLPGGMKNEERMEGEEEREMEERDKGEAKEREEEGEEIEESSLRGCVDEDSNSGKEPNSINNDSEGNSTIGATYDFNISEVFQCNNFGIVDCLTSVIKEPDTDDSESCSSDYGSGLGTSPPAKFSDTDSAIEALAVSSDLPLKGFPTPRPSALARRKKPDMGSIRWRSCAELTQKYRSSPASSVLKRQWSDRSLQARLQEQALRGMSVEVYDGDVGVSVLTLSSSSSALRRGQRSTKAGPEGDVAAQVEAKLLRNESRESQDLHDSLAVEASGSDFEVDGEEEDEAMETDECAPPPPTGSSKVPRPSSRRSRNSSRQRMSRTNKVLSKNKDQDDSVTSTTGRGSGSPVCIKRPLKDDVMLAIKIGHLKDKEMDHVLGIQEDDGSGPGLSEEELELSTSRELAGY
ncbi:uncharacterized protein LOC119594559 [Penaeus monodon]|uniref:uncharacterized protein LOC119594559 n=1 Tax=Penaeus monodon TaxID=6687 RepID=UPI0018A6D534|nr:uncharacterized protein LOC119594559 [Penaeus monodon]